MTAKQIEERQAAEAAKLAAKYEAARKIREALDEAEKAMGEEFDEDEILEIVNE